MDESILNALMQLFAVGALLRRERFKLERSRKVILEYLERRLNKELTEKYLNLFERYVADYQKELDTDEKLRKRLSAHFVKILKIAERVNETLDQKEKFIVIIRLLEFFNLDGLMSSEEEDFVSTVASIFNIKVEDYLSLKFFIVNEFDKIPHKENLLFISSEKIKGDFKFKLESALDKALVFLFISSIDTLFFKYLGNLPLRLTSRNVINNITYVFDSGAIIRGPKIKPIYQTQIISYFIHPPDLPKVKLVAKDIEFTYPKSDNGIKRFSFEAESGQLIGILGASGAGKSTLLNLLIGKLKVDRGSITINGYDIYKDRDKLIPLIGYVPQDDLLIEELTVYQNLYYNAKLCFGNLSDSEIRAKVDKVLKDLDLYEIKDLKVGNPLNKYISGGQRKRLNIALELIREPAILFVDEPTSGLSSMDSENVMHLLKRQAISGKLVIVNIHQPSSDIFKMFDSIIVLDKGGYPVYKGNPLDAISYFKLAANFADADVAECPVCGTVHPELILEIVEDKMVNELGKYLPVRKTSPKEWYILYRVSIERYTKVKIPEKTPLPKTQFKQPSKLKQFWIYFKRDVLSKLMDLQYVLINLLEPIILAVILAYLTRTPNEDGIYVFMENLNLPVFIFMAVIVALFLGLSISAEEIVNDRKILERERFLQLSKFSYLSSKVIVLMLISAYQMFVFALIASKILGINGLLIEYWWILFSLAVSANLLGLIISASFKSVVTIYITIPLLLVPQMLLGGAMIHFDDLPKEITNKKYTPVVADLMFSRWGYEALAVIQFKDNLYERHFFDLEKQRSDAVYMAMYYVPELRKIVDKVYLAKEQGYDEESLEDYIKLINNEINWLNSLQKYPKFENYKIDYETIDERFVQHFKEYLSEIQKIANIESNKITRLLEQRIDSLRQIYGREGLIKLKQDNYNNKLARIVLNRNRVKQIVIYEDRLVRKKDPIFMDPLSHWGRAHFYAAHKFIGNQRIPTLWFNTIVLWLYVVLMFLILYWYNHLGRIIKKWLLWIKR